MGASPTWKASWRFCRSWLCHNHKLYYTYVVFCSFVLYQTFFATFIGYYRNRNHHRSIEWAIQAEKEYQLIKPKEVEYDDEEEEEAEAAGGDAAEAEEEEEWIHSYVFPTTIFHFSRYLKI